MTDSKPTPIPANGYQRGAAIGIWVLTLLAIFYTLYFAASLLLPIVLAVLLSFLLSPVMRGLQSLKLPAPVGAGLLIFAFVASLALVIYALHQPAMQWVERMPETGAELVDKFEDVFRGVEDVRKAAQEAEKVAESVGSEDVPEVKIEQATFGDVVLSATGEVAIGGMIMLTLLFFLLAGDELFLQRLVSVMPRVRDKRKAVAVVRRIEDDVSSYLLAYAINNAILGAVVAGVLWLLDFPNPVLAGVIAAIFNFIPYAGLVVSLTIITLISAVSYESITAFLLPPVSFFILSSLEGTFMQPAIVGRHLSLNLVSIFVSLIFWGWLWGIVGALLAVPILAVIKTLLDGFDATRRYSVFLAK